MAQLQTTRSRAASPSPRRRRPAAAAVPAAAAAVLLAAVLALGAYLVVGRAHHGVAARRPAAARPAPKAPAGPPAGSAAAGRGHGQLQLVTGSRLVNGVYTDYPQSRAGAVSAAAEFITELGSTLNPDRAATVARLAAGPAYPDAPQQAAQGTISIRRRLGLPAAGALPPGTAVFLVPVMFQLREVAARALTVLLLFDYTETVPSGIREHLGVTAARLSWTPAGWRLLQPAGPAPAGLIATPGTAAAAAKGWEAMTDAL